MKTFLVYYYIIPGCLRKMEMVGNSYSDIKKDFVYKTGISLNNLLYIKYSY